MQVVVAVSDKGRFVKSVHALGAGSTDMYQLQECMEVACRLVGHVSSQPTL